MTDPHLDQEKLSTHVLNSTNEAIIAIDNSHRIVLINPAAQTLTGFEIFLKIKMTLSI